MVLDLPDTLIEILKEKAEGEDESIEGFLADVLLDYLDVNDPDSRAETYRRLSEKFLKEAEELLREGDLVQASEKAWGASAQKVKAAAAERGIRIRSHRELHRFVENLADEMEDEELKQLWLTASSLHQNFYENWLSRGMVESGVRGVKRFIEKLG
jgi:HEPN domain-containing protein